MRRHRCWLWGRSYPCFRRFDFTPSRLCSGEHSFQDSSVRHHHDRSLESKYDTVCFEAGGKTEFDGNGYPVTRCLQLQNGMLSFFSTQSTSSDYHANSMLMIEFVIDDIVCWKDAKQCAVTAEGPRRMVSNPYYVHCYGKKSEYCTYLEHTSIHIHRPICELQKRFLDANKPVPSGERCTFEYASFANVYSKL